MGEAGVPDSHSFDVILSERQKVKYVFDLYINCFNCFRLYRTGFLEFICTIIIIIIIYFLPFSYASFAITCRISRPVIIT